jgi:thiamine biosynthesis lipoprotein
VAGPPPEGGWLVGVADGATFDSTTATVESTQVIVVRDGGLATSSVLGRSWRRGQAQLHHIIDPRTGLPARPYWRTVSVAARSCVDANTASTAAIVRGERAANWLALLGLPARLVAQDGSVVTVAGWPAAEENG